MSFSLGLLPSLSRSTWVTVLSRGGCWGQQKYSTYMEHSLVLSFEIASFKLCLFFPGSLTFLLSMGKNDGVGQVNGYYVGRLLVTIAKSRDLFVSKSWKTMGQTMPS